MTAEGAKSRPPLGFCRYISIMMVIDIYWSNLLFSSFWTTQCLVCILTRLAVENPLPQSSQRIKFRSGKLLLDNNDEYYWRFSYFQFLKFHLPYLRRSERTNTVQRLIENSKPFRAEATWQQTISFFNKWSSYLKPILIYNMAISNYSKKKSSF